MRKPFIAFWLPALVASAGISVAAHHNEGSYYDATTLASMSGQVVELRTVNPHAVLILEGTGPDGRTGRWAFEGLPPNAYQYRGLKDYRDRLKPGTLITISGWPAKDPQERAFRANTVTFADRTTMLFGSATLPEGRWSLVGGCAAPCPAR
jgi:hypothetical protein